MNTEPYERPPEDRARRQSGLSAGETVRVLTGSHFLHLVLRHGLLFSWLTIAILHREYLASQLASFWGFQAQLNVGTDPGPCIVSTWFSEPSSQPPRSHFPPTPTHRNQATLSILAVTVILKYTLVLIQEVARLTDAALLADEGEFGTGLLTAAIQVGTGGWTGGKAAGEVAVGWALQSCAVQKELV